MVAQVQRAGEAVVIDCAGRRWRRGSAARSGRGRAFAAGQLEREQPVEVPGNDGQSGVKANVEGTPLVWAPLWSRQCRRRVRFHRHALGVAGEEVVGVGGEVVCDQQGGSVAADIFDCDLADPGADAGDLPAFVQAGRGRRQRPLRVMAEVFQA